MGNLDGSTNRIVARTFLAVIISVAVVVTVALCTHKSGMPVVFGLYSIKAFIVICVLVLFSLILTVIVVAAPAWLLARTAVVLSAIVGGWICIDILAFVAASRLPYGIWMQMPYQVKQMTYGLQSETALADQKVIVEEQYWAFEPYYCVEWPLYGHFGPFPPEKGEPVPGFEVCHDEIGFRNPVGTFAHNESVDVVILGDSLTYGFASEMGWPDFFRVRTNLRVLNLAHTGGSVPQWIGTFREFGIEKKPSLVIAAFSDATGFANLAQLGVLDKEVGGNDSLEMMMHVSRDFEGTNPAYRLAEYSLTLTTLLKTWQNMTLWENDSSGSEVMSLSLDEGSTRIDLWTNRRPDFRDDARTWSLFEMGVQELKKMSDGIGAQLVLIHLTTAAVVYAPYDIDLPLSVVADVENQREISQILSQMASSHDILFLNIGPLLQIPAANTPLLYIWDGHFSLEGYEVVADVVYEYLSQRSVLGLVQ